MTWDPYRLPASRNTPVRPLARVPRPPSRWWEVVQAIVYSAFILASIAWAAAEWVRP